MVNYVYGAEDGATTSPTDINAIIQQALGGGAQDELALNLVKLLLNMSPQMIESPLSTVLGEQRQRASLAAQSANPATQYLPGLNPGGLWDTLSGWIGMLGGMAPQLDPGQRLVNRTPLDPLGGSFEEAMALANKAAASNPMVSPQLDPRIQQIIAPLIEKVLGIGTTAAPAAAPSVDTSLRGTGGTGELGGVTAAPTNASLTGVGPLGGITGLDDETRRRLIQEYMDQHYGNDNPIGDVISHIGRGFSSTLDALKKAPPRGPRGLY